MLFLRRRLIKLIGLIFFRRKRGTLRGAKNIEGLTFYEDIEENDDILTCGKSEDEDVLEMK